MTVDRRSINQSLVSFNLEFTTEQQQARKVCHNNVITILTGMPGSSKSLVACSVAVELLKHKSKQCTFSHEMDYSRVNKIILMRPTVIAQETTDLGALKGDAFDLRSGKLAPYISPLTSNIKKLCGEKDYNDWVEKGMIEILPVQFARGHTFENCIVIFDELQNATKGQLQLVVSRLGHNAKIIMTSDINQSDLKNVNKSASMCLSRILNYEGVDSFELTENFRHRLAQQLHKELMVEEIYHQVMSSSA